MALAVGGYRQRTGHGGYDDLRYHRGIRLRNANDLRSADGLIGKIRDDAIHEGEGVPLPWFIGGLIVILVRIGVGQRKREDPLGALTLEARQLRSSDPVPRRIVVKDQHHQFTAVGVSHS